MTYINLHRPVADPRELPRYSLPEDWFAEHLQWECDDEEGVSEFIAETKAALQRIVTRFGLATAAVTVVYFGCEFLR